MHPIEKPEDVVTHLESRKTLYAWCYGFSSVATLVLGLMITISGSLSWPINLAFLGALSTFVLGVEKAFAFADKRAMYKSLAGEAQTLLWRLKEAESDASQAHLKKMLTDLVNSASRFDSKRGE